MTSFSKNNIYQEIKSLLNSSESDKITNNISCIKQPKEQEYFKLINQLSELENLIKNTKTELNNFDNLKNSIFPNTPYNYSQLLNSQAHLQGSSQIFNSLAEPMYFPHHFTQMNYPLNHTN